MCPDTVLLEVGVGDDDDEGEGEGEEGEDGVVGDNSRDDLRGCWRPAPIPGRPSKSKNARIWVCLKIVQEFGQNEAQQETEKKGGKQTKGACISERK